MWRKSETYKQHISAEFFKLSRATVRACILLYVRAHRVREAWCQCLGESQLDPAGCMK